MSVKLIVSPPASGKTEYCLKRILEVSKTKTPVNIWVLVPDGYQAIAIRQRLAKAGGAIGVVVNTFGSFHRHLLETNNIFYPPAPNAVIQQLVRKSIEKVDLNYFSSIAHLPGFVEELILRFKELKRGMVFPDVFTKAVEERHPRLIELAKIFSVYQRKLAELGWADNEGFGWLAVELLESNPELSPGYDLLILDGYDSFTEPQYQTIALMAERLPEILITLPGSKPNNRRVEQRFEETYRRILKIPGIEEIEFAPHLPARSPTYHLIQNLGERDVDPIDTKNQVLFIETRSQAEEAREALRWIKALIIRNNVSLHECVVVTPEPAAYQPYLKAAAREFGLPVRFSLDMPLTYSPAFAAFENLLEVIPKRLARRQLLDTIRSPYFDLSVIGVSGESVVILDQVSRAFQVFEDQKIWFEVLDILAQKADNKDDPVDLEDDEFKPRLPSSEEAKELKVALQKLVDLLTPKVEEQTITDWVYWTEDLLDELKFFEGSDITEDKVSFGLMRRMFRDLVLAEEVAGETQIDYLQYVRILHQTAAALQIPDITPFNQPAVKILRNVEGRGLRSQAVAVLGLAEGVFPKVQRPDPFLDEDIRKELGIEPSVDPHQLGLFYLAATRSDRFLLLSRPYLAADGEKWEPSPYWELARELFTNDPIYINPDAARQVRNAASEAEALAWTVRARQVIEEIKNDFVAQLKFLEYSHAILAAREAEQPGGLHEGYTLGLADMLTDEFGSKKIWSASSLEAYTTCPYQFYVGKVLGLESLDEPELGFDVRQLGNLLHRILEYSYASAEDPTDLDSVMENLNEISIKEFDKAPETEGFRPTALWEKEKNELSEKLKKTVAELHKLSAGWTPYLFEARFGMDPNKPSILEIEGVQLKMRGLIDRVDKNAAGQVRIIDYKTGSGHQEKKDLLNGRRLQLALYALAAEKGLNIGEVIDGFYWPILRAKKGGLSLQKLDGGPQEAYDIALSFFSRAVNGARQGEFPPVPPEGGCPSYCAAASWCWRYEPAEWGA